MEFKLTEYHRNVSNEELLEDIIRVANSLRKGTITRLEYSNNGGRFHPSIFNRRFGGWLHALRKCNLSPDRTQITNTGISENDLINDLKIVANKLGKSTITSSEYASLGHYSKSVYFRRYGSWNVALVSAGLLPFDHPLGGGSKNKIEMYDCLEEIERIWIKLGRQPTTTDIKNGVSRYSLHVYERRFGSWRKALEFFVSYMNNEHEIEKTDKTEDAIQLPYINQEQIENGKQTHKTKREINLRLRFLVMKRDNFKCCICGRSPSTTAGLELHIDHIIPWSKGGETVEDNLQTLCSDCNLGKGNME